MRVYSVSLENTKAASDAPFREKYREVFVQAASFSEAAAKAEDAHPTMEASSVTVQGDSLLL